MATGITYPIQERDVGLREYLERCWALCTREHGVDAPLPELILEDSHYADRVIEAEADVARAETLTLEQAAADLADAQARSVVFWREHGERQAALRKRYDKLMASIESWNPPPDAAGYREMALRHLCESRDFDCPSNSFADDKPITAEEWLADKRRMAARALERAKVDHARHIENVRRANAVLVAIRAVNP